MLDERLKMGLHTYWSFWLSSSSCLPSVVLADNPQLLTETNETWLLKEHKSPAGLDQKLIYYDIASEPPPPASGNT